jgi:hypothetical protein
LGCQAIYSFWRYAIITFSHSDSTCSVCWNPRRLSQCHICNFYDTCMCGEYMLKILYIILYYNQMILSFSFFYLNVYPKIEENIRLDYLPSFVCFHLYLSLLLSCGILHIAFEIPTVCCKTTTPSDPYYISQIRMYLDTF